MLSIGVIGPAGVDYYLGTVASGVDDYYLHAEPGTWYGTGAAALGLAGVVVDHDLHAVLDGVAPHGAGTLGRATKVAAFDCTFSAPKSVSVLAELGDPDTRDAVLEAHRAALASTVGLLEAEVIRGRRGHGGDVQIPTTGLVAAGFDHRASRAGDPQLHTHLLVANRAQGIDGAWGALYGRRLFAWAKTAGIAYQAFLRAELNSALGVSWGPVVNGTAEVTGISEGLRELFSTRRAQITAHLAGEGREGPRAAQVATLATRPPKPDPIHPDIQRAHWQEQAAELGVTSASLGAMLGPRREPIAVDLGSLAQELTGAGGLTARRSTFDARHLYQAIAGAHRDGLRPVNLIELVETMQRHAEVLEVGVTVLAGPSWTTAELAASETRLLQVAARGQDAGIAVCPVPLVEAVLARRVLAPEQADMVRRLCGSGHAVQVVVGRPGTGKTYALDAATATWAAVGSPVIGAALAARTARALEAATGVPSHTLDALLGELARPGANFKPGTVLLIDESGMIGTRSLDRLLGAAEHHQAKIVLIGDPAQMPELEAGGAFAALSRTAPSVELTVNRRQTNAWERDALERIRSGTAGDAVGRYRQAGRLTLTEDAVTARSLLIADWARTAPTRAAGNVVMVALTRTEVDDLNQLARAHLVRIGAVAADGVEVAGMTFGVGDRVMALRNDRRLGVLNGTAGTVTATAPDGPSISCPTPAAP